MHYLNILFEPRDLAYYNYWDFFYFLRLQACCVWEAAVFLEEIPRNIVLTFWFDSDSLKMLTPLHESHFSQA